MALPSAALPDGSRDVCPYAEATDRTSIEVAGRVLVTTLTDAQSVSPLDLDTFYRQRWQVEVDLRSLKAVRGMDILRAQSPHMIDKEMAAYLLAYNLVGCLMVRAAAEVNRSRTGLEFQGNAATVLGVSTSVAQGCGKARDQHTDTPPQRGEHDGPVDSTWMCRAASHHAKAEQSSLADSASIDGAYGDHLCASILCFKLVPCPPRPL